MSIYQGFSPTLRQARRNEFETVQELVALDPNNEYWQARAAALFEAEEPVNDPQAFDDLAADIEASHYEET